MNKENKYYNVINRQKLIVFMYSCILLNGGRDSVMDIRVENEISMVSSISDQFCLIHFALLPLEKVWINLLPAMEDWAFLLWGDNQSERKKTLNSKAPWSRMCYIRLTWPWCITLAMAAVCVVHLWP